MPKTIVCIFMSVCSLSAYAQYADVHLGDILDVNGIKGIVYEVDENGEHGKMMSIKCLRGVGDSWCSDKKLAKSMPEISDREDGLANTQAVISFAKDNNALDKFPVFKWCTELGEGWYVPSYKELESFVNFWLGNVQEFDWDAEEDFESEIDESKPYYKQINNKMLDAGGIPFLNGVYTSTVNGDDKVYVYWFNRNKNTWAFKKRSKDNLSKYFTGRAFYRF